jgi:hypothetical protein
MNIPENLTDGDIRAVLIQLSEKVEALNEKLEKKIDNLDEKVERLDYKFDVYQKGTDAMVRMATTISIAAASVLILSNLSPAISKVVTAMSSN